MPFEGLFFDDVPALLTSLQGTVVLLNLVGIGMHVVYQPR